MRPVPRTRVAILLATALVAPTAANDSGEIGITAQNTHELKILSGNGHIETVPLPDRSQPHTITFFARRVVRLRIQPRRRQLVGRAQRRTGRSSRRSTLVPTGRITRSRHPTGQSCFRRIP
jgi:hypothetical protein